MTIINMNFRLPNINTTNKNDIEHIISSYINILEERVNHHMGYPFNLVYDYSSYGNLLRYTINNVGDPFIGSNYGTNSGVFEIAILNWFADLWKINRNEYWGYVTCCGTEGNLQGLYLGREKFPNGILYASEDSHYSIVKSSRMFKIDFERIKSTSSGSIDINNLRDALIKNKGRPAIINVNIGTTLKGAIDDLDGIIECLVNTGYTENDFYIHCDGALVGLMLTINNEEYLSFKKPIHSISVSGHKLIGCPIPCGILITRKCVASLQNIDIDYINSKDTTLMGSRAGLPCIFIWDYLVKYGLEGIKKNICECIKNAEYLKQRLQEIGIRYVLLNECSNTVVFTSPSSHLIQKWQLASSNEICHIVVMPNINRNKIDEFIIDYSTELST